MTKEPSSCVAIVTGSTQGLGEAIARQLIADQLVGGLVICGRNAERGKNLAAEFTGLGCRAEFVATDLAKLEDVLRIVDVARSKFGRTDYLVNSAATSERGTLVETSPELYERIMAINVRAPFFLMQGAAKLMLERGTPGAIVNILSMSAHGGQPFLTPYSMSKGALVTLTKNVANSLLKDRIRVNGLNIGWMDSPGEDAIQRKAHGATTGWLERAESTQPLGRLVKPAEVAKVVSFLLSERAGLMTGSIIDFDQQVLGTSS